MHYNEDAAGVTITYSTDSILPDPGPPNYDCVFV